MAFFFSKQRKIIREALIQYTNFISANFDIILNHQGQTFGSTKKKKKAENTLSVILYLARGG